jgi:hypothetical protein
MTFGAWLPLAMRRFRRARPGGATNSSERAPPKLPAPAGLVPGEAGRKGWGNATSCCSSLHRGKPGGGGWLAFVLYPNRVCYRHYHVRDFVAGLILPRPINEIHKNRTWAASIKVPNTPNTFFCPFLRPFRDPSPSYFLSFSRSVPK